MADKECEYCGETINVKPAAEHYRNCPQAINARRAAAVNLAMELDDVESIKNILEPVSG